MAFSNIKARMAYFAKQKDKQTGMTSLGSIGKGLTSKPALGTPNKLNPNMKISGPNLALPKEPSMPKTIPNEPKSPGLPKMAKFPRMRKFFKG